MPWSRCLAVASAGNQFAMVMNMTYSTKREKVFLYSRPYYSTNSFYYYSR